MRLRLFLPLFAVTGCAPSVQLATPQPMLSTGWSVAPGDELAGESRRLAASLRSPELSALVAQALAANPDLGAAAARIQQARAQLRTARAESLPTGSLAVGGRSIRSDDPGSSPFDFSVASAGLDLSWELDLFGRQAAGRRSARARVAAAAFDRDALALVIEAELARAFVQHAVLSHRIDLIDRNIASARDLERIIGVRLRLGAATRVDAGIQAVEVRQLEVERTRLVEARARTRSALALLAGAEAPLFTAPEVALDALSVPVIATVQPAQLLVRRPDVRAAEARIAAAEGDVDRARAAFLPSIRLSASGLGQAAALGGPIGLTASIGADLLAPIFNRGRLRGELDFASGAQRESVELYRSALLSALREAEDALVATEQSRQRAALLDQIVEEARTTARLARLQYVEGYTDLQTVLSAEEQLVAVEDARAVALQQRFEAAIDLYRAMGGPGAPAAVAARH
ncbi:efflux transporter outer membrane subunit [Sphingosinicella sp. YJ22]|uniref:efflux transporter outer membrane subunit n=1 Tax=Sphingosinicella sp. YJ22 TaxID=1104780 RepID=UPI00140D91DB|nr:efflux transporter outer membrane subunit [Sphingosinicella sp. YJ22]